MACSHVAELYQHYNMFTPGDLSAQPQEKKNKFFHIFRSNYSRQVTLKQNLEDCFIRDWLYTSPLLARMGVSKRCRKSITCSNCQGVGHNKRTCPRPDIPNDDAIVEEDEGEPVPEGIHFWFLYSFILEIICFYWLSFYCMLKRSQWSWLTCMSFNLTFQKVKLKKFWKKNRHERRHQESRKTQILSSVILYLFQL